MKTIKEQTEVMQAYLDGKTIKQTTNISVGVTEKFCHQEGLPPHLFNWAYYDYDIVEKPIIQYMIVTKSGHCVSSFEHRRSAKSRIKEIPSNGYRIIKVVQDMDYKGD